jgi:hypothetical protein
VCQSCLAIWENNSLHEVVSEVDPTFWNMFSLVLLAHCKMMMDCDVRHGAYALCTNVNACS